MELAKTSPVEDAGMQIGSQTELQLSPRGAQRRAKGAKREPKGIQEELLLHIFLLYWWLRFGIVFLMVLPIRKLDGNFPAHGLRMELSQIQDMLSSIRASDNKDLANNIEGSEKIMYLFSFFSFWHSLLFSAIFIN